MAHEKLIEYLEQLDKAGLVEHTTIDDLGVVRCKDCKYWITKGWLTEDTNIKVCNRLECLEGCDSTCWDMEADDFCSRGVKK